MEFSIIHRLLNTLIVASKLTLKYFQFSLNMINKNIHFFYVAVILTGLLILETTAKVGHIESVVSYISFASTITSLILALAAIIYSYIANSSQGKISGNLQESANKINDIATEVTTEMHNLCNQITNIPVLIGNVEKKVDTTHDFFRTMSNSNENSKSHATDTEDTSHISQMILDKGSFLALSAIYIASKSIKHKIAISAGKIDEIFFNNANDYMLGSLALLSSLQLIEYKFVDDIYTFSTLDNNLNSKIQNRINTATETYEDSKEIWKGYIERIDTFFSTT